MNIHPAIQADLNPMPSHIVCADILNTREFFQAGLQIPIYPKTDTTPNQRKERKTRVPVCRFPGRFYELNEQSAGTNHRM